MGVSFDDLVFVMQGTGIRQATVAFPNGYVEIADLPSCLQ